MNLADHVGDAPTAVVENRRRAADALGLADPAGWAWLEQVHGIAVRRLTVPGPAPSSAADAAVTSLPGLPLVVLTADCAPVAIACDDAVGVVHAGWRGLLDGVVEAAVEALRSVGRGPVQAAIGPCIRPADYEFGANDLAPLVGRFGTSVAARTRDGLPALDLAAGVRAACARCGVTAVDDLGECTFADPRWFSHRRDGRTGRQAVIVVKQ